MTTNEILATVREKIVEEGEEIIDTAKLLRYVNEAYMDVWKQVFANSDIATVVVALTSGAGTLPANVGTLYGDATDTAGNLYPEVSIEDFHRRTLERMVTIEAGQLKVYPTTVASLTIRFWPKPDTLIAGNTPSINAYFHEPIVYGTLERCFEDLQDEDLASYYAAKFEKKLAQRIANQSAYEETNQRGAVMFTHQNLVGGGFSLDNPNSF